MPEKIEKFDDSESDLSEQKPPNCLTDEKSRVNRFLDKTEEDITSFNLSHSQLTNLPQTALGLSSLQHHRPQHPKKQRESSPLSSKHLALISLTSLLEKSILRIERSDVQKQLVMSRLETLVQRVKVQTAS